MFEIIKNAEGRDVIEYKAIRLIREHFEKKGDRCSVENLDTDHFGGILPIYRNLRLRFRNDAGEEREYTIVHNHLDGNSVSVSGDVIARVPKDKEAAALRAINAFNAESCTMLVMGIHEPLRGDVRLEDCIPDDTADEDAGKLVEDMIALFESEYERARSIPETI